jgi:predicted nucleotidyltransferase
MTREEVLQALSSYHEALADLGVKSLALFGSAARGEAREGSDVDLLVEFDRPVGLFAFLDVKEFLENILGCPVDLGTPESLHPRLRTRVMQEAVYVT